MRPLVSPRVVIHVAVTVFSILPPWFASAAANVLSVLNTIMPHAKVVTHLMSDDLVIGMICIQHINMAYNNSKYLIYLIQFEDSKQLRTSAVNSSLLAFPDVPYFVILLAGRSPLQTHPIQLAKPRPLLLLLPVIKTYNWPL